MEEYYYSNADARRLTHQVRLLCLVPFCLLQFPPAWHQNEKNCLLRPQRNAVAMRHASLSVSQHLTQCYSLKPSKNDTQTVRQLYWRPKYH